MFVAALSDVVQQDVAPGRLYSPETETTKPGSKGLWLPYSSYEGNQQAESDYVTSVGTKHDMTTDVHPPGNKTRWLDTETAKPPRNKAQWQDSDDNKAQWSGRTTPKMNKGRQWEDDSKYQSEKWQQPSLSDEPGKKAQWRDTADSDKAKGRNEPDTVTTAKAKKQLKHDTKPTSSESSSEPILMKLPKVTILINTLDPL